MSVNKAVRKLNQDMQKLNKDLGAEKKARTNVTKAQASEKAALTSISTQQTAIVDAFENPAAPLTATQQTADLNKLYSLGQSQIQTTDRFTAAIAKDKGAVTKDAKAAGSDRKQALKDLKPAEEHLNLKDTNIARKKLGLRALSKPVRAPATGVKNTVGGQVGSWIAQAQTILQAHGIPLSNMNAADIALIIQHESSGNPNAINNWDSNAAAGHPSEGLMQTIGPTFNSYALPGHDQILNPVDNIIAGVRYAISRYGSISNVPGVIDVHNGGSYVGY
jgi:soluble lytic murein transglycosylase-like protein